MFIGKGCYGVQPEDEALQRNELDGGTPATSGAVLKDGQDEPLQS